MGCRRGDLSEGPKMHVFSEKCSEIEQIGRFFIVFRLRVKFERFTYVRCAQERVSLFNVYALLVAGTLAFRAVAQDLAAEQAGSFHPLDERGQTAYVASTA